MIEYLYAGDEETYAAAAALFRDYAADIGIDLNFQNFEHELQNLAGMYGSPVGGIILCRQDVRYAGCVAIRQMDNTVCELKRMYVKPSFRNKGIGKNLLEQAISLAKKLHYKKMRLDTLDNMTAAIKLYEAYGFVKIDPYYFNPNDNALFFEKEL